MTTTRKQPSDQQEIFGPYVVYERLGVGGMATVHRAKEHGIEGFERIVALKRLLPHLAEDASFVRSFVREAKLASMLQHANIVQLYELGRVGHVLFISMEHIEGRDVRKVLRQARKVAGPPPLPVFLALMIQLCDALDYAHDRSDQNGDFLGLVHRDVSPSNLLITGTGHLKVIDFGIAKAQTAHLRTQTGRVKGKLAYMAPEALRAQDLDARSDIFSAGVIAHELLTARPLFACKNEYQTILRVHHAEIEPPSRYNPVCPPELDHLVHKALARDADDRWRSAAEWRDALDDLRARLGLSATNREVASWMEWAFATEAPPTGAFRRPTSGTGSPGTGQLPELALTPLALRAPPRSSPGAEGAIGARKPAPVLPLPRMPLPAPAPAVPEADETVVELAWGGEEADAQAAPVELDDIPDVSMKMKAVSEPRETADARERSREDVRVGVDLGAGVIAMHKRRKRRKLAIAALLAVAACAGVVAHVALQPPGAPAPAAPVAGEATLKFVVEPADAVIDVQGYGSHQGSPLVLDVAAPATYRVEIRREGYQSYVSELEVSSDGTYVVQMPLQRGGSHEASLIVRSSPSGQEVVIDGEATGARTPSEHEIGPGEHVISIVDDEGNEQWRHVLVAVANTHYELHPALPERRASRDERGRHRSERRRRRSEVVTVVGGTAISDAETARDPGAPASGRPSAPFLLPGPGSMAPNTPSVLSGIELAEPPAVALPAPPGRPRPVTILPTKVQKLSGRLPIVSAAKGTLPSRSSAKLCIDERGAVVSVELLTEMPRRVQRELRRAFERWRYTPYTEGGKASPACFAITFRVIIDG